MTVQNLHYKIETLSILEISDFFKEHDNDYFERLSDRVDIDEYSKKLFDNSVKFTIRDNVDLIGLSPCYFNNVKEKVGYISSLTIKEGFRGKKLGSKLINQIKQYAKTRGFNTVMVKINFNNEINLRFYLKNGFFNFVQDQQQDFRLLRLEVN